LLLRLRRETVTMTRPMNHSMTYKSDPADADVEAVSNGGADAKTAQTVALYSAQPVSAGERRPLGRRNHSASCRLSTKIQERSLHEREDAPEIVEDAPKKDRTPRTTLLEEIASI